MVISYTHYAAIEDDANRLLSTILKQFVCGRIYRSEERRVGKECLL